MNYVTIKFNSKGYQASNDTLYSFKCDLQELNVGDYAVCDCSTGYAVGKVEAILPFCETGKSSRWIIQKVDTTTHQVRLEAETRRREIRAKMDARRKQLEDMQLYKMLAENDPDMAKLIEEYYSTTPKLGGTI